MNSIKQHITIIILVYISSNLFARSIANIFYWCILQLINVGQFLIYDIFIKRNTHHLYFSKLISLLCRTVICGQKEYILIFVVKLQKTYLLSFKETKIETQCIRKF